MHPFALKTLPFLLFFISTLSTTLGTSPVRAEADEWALSLSPGGQVFFLSSPAPPPLLAGPTLSLAAHYGLNDAFQLGLSAQGKALFSTDSTAPSAAASLTLEARYLLDHFTWVPFVGLGLGALWADHQPSPVGFSPIATGTLGVHRRASRAWSFGASIRTEWAFLERELSPSLGLQLDFTFYLD